MLVPAANEVWGKPVTFRAAMGGWTAGSIDRLRRRLLRARPPPSFRDRKDLEHYEKLASKRMKLWAAILLCLAVPSELPGYLFGALRYPFVKFLIAIGIAEAVYASDSWSRARVSSRRSRAMLVATGVALVLVAVGAGYMLRSVVSRKRALLLQRRKVRCDVARHRASERPRIGIAPVAMDALRRLQPRDDVRRCVFGKGPREQAALGRYCASGGPRSTRGARDAGDHVACRACILVDGKLAAFGVGRQRLAVGREDPWRCWAGAVAR